MHRIGFVFLLCASGILARTITNASIEGFGTTVINARAEAYYDCGFSPFCFDASPISATADASALTLGPVRLGFLRIIGTGGTEGRGGGTDAVFIGSYEAHCGFACPGTFGGAPIPFMLGVPFDIHVAATAAYFNGVDRSVTGSGYINVNFSLFDILDSGPNGDLIPGSSVTIYDAAVVPEPATWMLVGAGLCLAGRRRRAE